MPYLTITRVSDTTYSVQALYPHTPFDLVWTDAMELEGTTLRSKAIPGLVRMGGTRAVCLGPKALQRVTALTVGQCANF